MKKLIFSNNILFIFFFIVSALVLHYKSFNKYPSKIHGWAQGDHYALALGFVENDFDFFKPTTYTLSHQFPPKNKLKNPQGITAVDFPIFHFTVAYVMKLVDTTDPWVYRAVMLFFSFITLFFLFNTITLIKGFWEALFICSFIMFQPIYVYYQNGFHISMAALNSLLIAVSFLLRFLYFSKNKYFLLGVLFLTLASLIRFTQIIFTIAILCIFVWDFIKKRKLNLKVFYIIFSLLIVGLYFVYNKKIADIYGSVFLNTPNFENSFKSVILHLLIQIKSYLRGFLPIMHLIPLLIIIYFFFKNKPMDSKKSTFFYLWFLFSFIGVFIFNIIMTKNMADHDYYSLDTWLPVIVISLIYMVLNLDFSEYIKIKQLIIVILIGGMFAIAAENQNRKYKYLNTSIDIIMHDFKDSALFLNSFNIDENKTVVISHCGWNTPMVGWHKKVYRVAEEFKKEIPLIFNQKFDLIITHNISYKNIVLDNMPNFDKFVDKIADNGKVTIWKPKER